jgi:DNA-binding NarL/FixJ family response regulator
MNMTKTVLPLETALPDARQPSPWTAQKPAQIFLVDDHPIVREGLETRINQEPDLHVCGMAEDAPQAMERIDQLKPDLVITDLSLHGRAGLELIKDLENLHPALPVLVLSIHDEILWAERVLRAGAEGYIMKSQATQQVVNAIHHLLDGGVWISERINALLLRKYSRKDPPSSGSPLERLSDRELEVFHMIGKGMSVREIAEKLVLSAKTVEVHRERMKDKLQFKSSAELLRYAVTYAMEGQ